MYVVLLLTKDKVKPLIIGIIRIFLIFIELNTHNITKLTTQLAKYQHLRKLQDTNTNQTFSVTFKFYVNNKIYNSEPFQPHTIYRHSLQN
jgi:hypothetical protein